MSKPTLSSEIANIEKLIISLEHRNYTNVTMRIDETLKDLRQEHHNLKVANGDYDKDLSVNVDAGGTLVVKDGTTTISAGTDAIYAGQKLTITASVADGYVLGTITVNDVEVENNSSFIVDGDTTIEVEVLVLAGEPEIDPSEE